MANIKPAKLNFLKNSKFIIKVDGGASGDDYAGTCRSVRADPAGSTSTFYGMKPDAVYEENGGWNITFEFADDYEAATSLWNLMFDNDGEQIVIEFWPHSGGVGFSTTATAKAAGIGGTTREVATSSLTLACSKPTKIADPTPGVIEGA